MEHGFASKQPADGYSVESTGQAITVERVEKTTDEELEVVEREIGAEAFEASKLAEARRIFNSVATNTEDFTDFLTLPAYAEITSR